jgi:hypothetical protein
MIQKLSLSKVLLKPLSIPFMCLRNIYVERALQERRAAAIALERIETNAQCMAHHLDALVGSDAEANATIKELLALVQDIQASTAYNEVEMEYASAEL